MLRILSADIGQVSDPTALAVVDCEPTRVERRIVEPDPMFKVARERTEALELPPVSFAVRHLERPALGTPYPAVVDRIVELGARLRDYLLVVDATGVGIAVADMLEERGVAPVRVTITAGTDPRGEGLVWHVPKQALIAGVQVALGTHRLKVAPALPLAPVLLRELKDFRLKVTSSANLTFNAREGAHDDLVLSVSLAVWLGTLCYTPPPDAFVGCEVEPVQISPY